MLHFSSGSFLFLLGATHMVKWIISYSIEYSNCCLHSLLGMENTMDSAALPSEHYCLLSQNTETRAFQEHFFLSYFSLATVLLILFCFLKIVWLSFFLTAFIFRDFILLITWLYSDSQIMYNHFYQVTTYRHYWYHSDSNWGSDSLKICESHLMNLSRILAQWQTDD